MPPKTRASLRLPLPGRSRALVRIGIRSAALHQVNTACSNGVSATPVHEALRLLESEGQVDYLPNRGTTVRDIPSRVEDLYLLSVKVEGLGAHLGIRRMDASLPDRLCAIHKEMTALAVESGHGEALSALNRRTSREGISGDVPRPTCVTSTEPSSRQMRR